MNPIHHPDRPKDADYSAWDDADLLPQADLAVDSMEPVELVVPETVGSERLDKWLSGAVTEHSRSRLKHWIEAGHVTLNGRRVAPKAAVIAGDCVVLTPQPDAETLAFSPEPMPLNIVFEDEALLVIDKPAGLVVHPAAGNWQGTLLNGLLHHDPSLGRVARAGIVHRLDKDTSGLLVVAKTPIAQTALVRQLQERSVKREYLALVQGEVTKAGRVEAHIGRHPKDRLKMAVVSEHGRFAATRYEPVASLHHPVLGAVTLLRCSLETGRTHQIRVHMAYAGFPLVGDAVYGRKSSLTVFGRQALHARTLGLIHPMTQAFCQWQAGLPLDMAGLLSGLGMDPSEPL